MRIFESKYLLVYENLQSNIRLNVQFATSFAHILCLCLGHLSVNLALTQATYLANSPHPSSYCETLFVVFGNLKYYFYTAILITLPN
jgi:hypothetical protein